MGENSQEMELGGIFLEKFKKIRKERIRETKEKFSKEKPRIRAGIEREIEKDQRHRDLLNMCIFPFCRPGKITDLGYRFIAAEPLAELGVKNFDFLIYNQRNKVAVFGEAKGSVSNPHKTVSETNERIDVVREQLEYISKTYMGESPSWIEFVIGVYAMDDEKIIREIHNKGGGIIVWSIDWYNSTLTPKTLLDNQNKAIELGMVHRDPSLIKAIKNVQTSHKVFEIFSSSHIFSLLRIILLAKTVNDEGSLILNEKDLMGIIREELFYLDEMVQKKKVDAILNTAESIKFLRSVSPGVFKVVSRYRADKSLEKDLKRKYIRYSERKHLKRAIEEAISEAEEEVREEMKRMSLEKWF
ncbi:MAG: hypothetical protein AYK18_06835 [Theionarchaea archaeon DG-70]|nr:MAG: hypothetical protein AYK18_06835 [Theionarchaea archaeon DG-70]